MKKAFAFLCLTFAVSNLHAQYAPFFTDQLDSNTHNWFVGKMKKSTVEFDHGDYSFYNDEGKSSIISLIDLPFDEKKNYRISSYAIERYIPSDEGMYGVMFAAKDEKNGYAVLLDQYGWCHVAKIEGGKIKELSKNSTSDENKDGGQISITLEDWRWQFKLGGKVMYTCDPLPWMGHKAGLYCAGEVSCSFADFIIEQATAVPNPCPLPFTPQELNEQLSKVICAAPDDFTALQGVHQSKEGDVEVWRTKDVTINGTADMFIGITAAANKKGRDFIIMFECTDSLSEDAALRFFDQLMKAINNVKPACGTFKLRDVKENVSNFLLKAARWDIDVKTPASGTVHVMVELDVNKFKGGVCYNSLHVNVPK